jgi:Xaa-Pro aminopeptidase
MSPRDHDHGIDVKEYSSRLERVRSALREAGAEVGAAYATTGYPADVQYLTGYDPHIESAAVLVFPNNVVVLGGAEGRHVFEDSAKCGEWRDLIDFVIPYQDYGDVRFWTLKEIFVDCLGHLPERIGLLSDGNTIPTSFRQQLGDAVTPSTCQFVDMNDALLGLRYEKSPTELALYRDASRIAGVAMGAMIDAVEPGKTELQIAAVGDYTIKMSGAYNSGFDTIVCSGPRINSVIGRATTRVISEGDMVMLGVAPRYNGYTSASGRTVVAGAPSPAQLELLHHAEHALHLAAAELREGNEARNVDAVPRQYLREHGLGDFHMYGVGHGIGLTECQEWKTATSASEYLLPRGISMQLDIGLFNHPDLYGLRIEEPYVIAHDGRSEQLTDVPMVTAVG